MSAAFEPDKKVRKLPSDPLGGINALEVVKISPSELSYQADLIGRFRCSGCSKNTTSRFKVYATTRKDHPFLKEKVIKITNRYE